jgi:hypothetical protein
VFCIFLTISVSEHIIQLLALSLNGGSVELYVVPSCQFPFPSCQFSVVLPDCPSVRYCSELLVRLLSVFCLSYFPVSLRLGYVDQGRRPSTRVDVRHSGIR